MSEYDGIEVDSETYALLRLIAGAETDNATSLVKLIELDPDQFKQFLKATGNLQSPEMLNLLDAAKRNQKKTVPRREIAIAVGAYQTGIAQQIAIKLFHKLKDTFKPKVMIEHDASGPESNFQYSIVRIIDPVTTDIPRLANILQPMLASPLYQIDVTVNNKPVALGKASENYLMITEAITEFLSS